MKRQTDIDFDREFVKVHRVKAGLDAARKKNTIAGYFAICVGGLVSGHARHPPDVVV